MGYVKQRAERTQLLAKLNALPLSVQYGAVWSGVATRVRAKLPGDHFTLYVIEKWSLAKKSPARYRWAIAKRVRSSSGDTTWEPVVEGSLPLGTHLFEVAEFALEAWGLMLEQERARP